MDLTSLRKHPVKTSGTTPTKLIFFVVFLYILGDIFRTSNGHYAIEDVFGSDSIAPRILDLGTGWS
jgi:hypothetical protein